MDYHYNLGIKFSAVAEKYGSKTAIRYPGGKSHSFAELDAASNQLAKYLKSRAVYSGQVVAIFNEKSFLAYSLMIACLKIGAIYSNLDITSPWARLHKILDTCKPSIVFFDKEESGIYNEFKL